MEKDARIYVAGSDNVLRTQTSPVQIRYLQSHRPPVRIKMLSMLSGESECLDETDRPSRPRDDAA